MWSFEYHLHFERKDQLKAEFKTAMKPVGKKSADKAAKYTHLSQRPLNQRLHSMGFNWIFYDTVLSISISFSLIAVSYGAIMATPLK